VAARSVISVPFPSSFHVVVYIIHLSPIHWHTTCPFQLKFASPVIFWTFKFESFKFERSQCYQF
jgi:hypothetical protein